MQITRYGLPQLCAALTVVLTGTLTSSSLALAADPPVAVVPEAAQPAVQTPEGVSSAPPSATRTQKARTSRKVSAEEDGSLWSDAGYNRTMNYDRKARSEGDLITVRILESSSAVGSGATSADRQSSASMGVSAALGLETSLASKFPNVKPEALLGGSTSNTFLGDASTTRSGNLTAIVTAEVVKILPNGNMLIKGTKQIKINNETQVLTVTGVVRPIDIGSTNQVDSTALAEARIEYTGIGVVADKQKGGLGSRLIDRAAPF